MPDKDDDSELHYPNDRWLPPDGVAGVVRDSAGCCLLDAIGCLWFSVVAVVILGLIVVGL
jgi:hypothetical protein